VPAMSPRGSFLIRLCCVVWQRYDSPSLIGSESIAISRSNEEISSPEIGHTS
jgi:hypothetical protein